MLEKAQEILRPEGCYSLLEVQEKLGIPFFVLHEAVTRGDIPRALGEFREMHILGLDVIDWLEARGRLLDTPAD